MISNNIVLMKHHGVGPEAISTTLPIAGYSDIREYLTQGILGYPLTYLYPKKPNNAFNAEVVLDLVCKELVLGQVVAHSLYLVDVHSALFSDDDQAKSYYNAMADADVICIRGFYQFGASAEQFFTPVQRQRMYSWMRQRATKGTHFVLQGETPPALLTGWWTHPLCAWVVQKGKHFEIGEVTTK